MFAKLGFGLRPREPGVNNAKFTRQNMAESFHWAAATWRKRQETSMNTNTREAAVFARNVEELDAYGGEAVYPRLET